MKKHIWWIKTQQRLSNLYHFHIHFNRWMDLLAVLVICLFALVWMIIFEASKFHFADDVTFVIFIFFLKKIIKKKTMDNRILNKNIHRYFWQLFVKILRTKKIRKSSKLERKSDYDFVGKEMIIFVTKSEIIKW